MVANRPDDRISVAQTPKSVRWVLTLDNLDQPDAPDPHLDRASICPQNP